MIHKDTAISCDRCSFGRHFLSYVEVTPFLAGGVGSGSLRTPDSAVLLCIPLSFRRQCEGLEHFKKQKDNSHFISLKSRVSTYGSPHSSNAMNNASLSLLPFRVRCKVAPKLTAAISTHVDKLNLGNQGARRSQQLETLR